MDTKDDASPVEIEEHIKGVTFPAKKRDLVNQAKDNNAPDDVISIFESFPEQNYDSPLDIARVFSEKKRNT